MTAFAGFYASPESWLNWMLSRPGCPDWQWGTTTAQLIINRVLREKKLGKHFYVELVPVPPSEPVYEGYHHGMMLVRRKRSKRAYIIQKPDSKYDLTGQTMIKELVGLEVSGWKTMWYNKRSQWPPYEAQFLEPGDSTEKRKTNRTTGNQKKNKVKAKVNVEIEVEMETETEGETGPEIETKTTKVKIKVTVKPKTKSVSVSQEGQEGNDKGAAEEKSEHRGVEAGVSCEDDKNKS